MIHHRGFTILEVLLALSIVALVMAVIAPAMVGALRAERQARRILEPLAQEQVALAQLHDDLWAAPQPTGSVCVPFTIGGADVGGHGGAMLVVTVRNPPPLHYRLLVSAPDLGQAVVTWAVQPSDDGRGLAWTRSAQANLLATGTAPAATPEVMLDHLDSLTIEALTNGAFSASYDSSVTGSTLPTAVRISYRALDDDGKAGPLRILVIDLPLVQLGAT